MGKPQIRRLAGPLRWADPVASVAELGSTGEAVCVGVELVVPAAVDLVGFDPGPFVRDVLAALR